MGLDMYLSAKVFVGAEYGHREVAGSLFITLNKERIDYGLDNLSYLEYQAGYWRKANHIHKWFVDNCQDGEDDCRESHVSREKLLGLLEICKQVIENNELAEELLPTESGFFFGPTAYDEYYYKDIEDTVKIIEETLNKYPQSEIYYRASW